MVSVSSKKIQDSIIKDIKSISKLKVDNKRDDSTEFVSLINKYIPSSNRYNSSTFWTGENSSYYLQLFSYYLQSKYHDTVYVDTSDLYWICVDKNKYFITSIKEDTGFLHSPSMKKIIDNIKNSSIKFIIIPIIITIRFKRIDNSNTSICHQNMILYDKNNNTVELFDPHGDKIKMALKKNKIGYI